MSGGFSRRCWANWCSGNIFDLHLGSMLIKWPGHQLCWLRFSVVFLSPLQIVHDHFLTDHSQFVIDQWSCVLHSIIWYIVEKWTTKKLYFEAHLSHCYMLLLFETVWTLQHSNIVSITCVAKHHSMLHLMVNTGWQYETYICGVLVQYSESELCIEILCGHN